MIVDDLIRAQANALSLNEAQIVGDPTLKTQFLAYCTHALRALEKYAPWPWLLVTDVVETTDGQTYVALPANFKGFAPDGGPYYADGSGALRHCELSELLELRRSGETEGQPSLWCEGFDTTSGTWTMMLYPTPDDAYEITVPYHRLLAAFADTGQTADVPAAMEATLELGCIAEAQEGWEQVAEGSYRGKFLAALEQDKRTWIADGQARLRMRGLRSDEFCRAEREFIPVVVTPPS